MPRTRLEIGAFVVILLASLALGALYAIYTPAWQAPDEPAHFNYIRQVAQEGCCPRIEAGDWDSAYLAELTSARFAPHLLDDLDAIQYEDHHPPLYYLLASLVYRPSGGDLIALRLLGAVLGAGVAAMSYVIARRTLPSQPQIALGVMALVAFLPQHMHMMSAVNNDALAELIVGAALLLFLRYVDDPEAPAWQLGAVAGLAILTKLTVAFLAPLALVVMWLRWRGADESPRLLLRAVGSFLLVALGISAVWLLRNLGVYGFPDVLGLAAHDRVVFDQPRTADFVAAEGVATYIARLLETTFKSFWGQFGWMALPLDGVLGGWVYRGFALLAGPGLAGAMLAGRGRDYPQVSRAVWIVMLAAFLLVGLQFAVYNLEFVQWQGRYFFPALIPIAFVLVYGFDCLRWRLLGRWAWTRWLTPLALCGLAALDVYLLFRVIAPGLSPV